MNEFEYKVITIFTSENKKYKDILGNAIKNYLKINNYIENNRFFNKDDVKYNLSK